MCIEKVISDLNKKYNKEIEKMKQRESNLSLEELLEFGEIVYEDGKNDKYISYIVLTASILTLIATLTIEGGNVPSSLIWILAAIVIIIMVFVSIFAFRSCSMQKKLRFLRIQGFLNKTNKNTGKENDKK